ncbi:hypothetical protein GCM10009630_15540 [Kribbella jejuensis]|uniref:Uncharacterized protein n=1 Tax=Kribbella jejuensis TaxID=236068 RepID=A0A542EAZ9_9ACTN|nr:hypothetical protein FB475_5437 [Kribbella jejuensis]
MLACVSGLVVWLGWLAVRVFVVGVLGWVGGLVGGPSSAHLFTLLLVGVVVGGVEVSVRGRPDGEAGEGSGSGVRGRGVGTAEDLHA